MENILQVKNLKVNFRTLNGTVQAVRGVTFDLHKGETLAIVGESGSGKSVTSKAIIGLLSNNAIIESGEILYRDQDVLKLSEKEFCNIRGQQIGMIFQDPMSSLNPIMTVGKQIAEPLILKLGYSKKDAKARVLELMKDVGIDHPERRYDQYPFQFSGGMRQRIVIAIALASNPEVLICDEPTTALDVTVQAQILELINSIKEKYNISVIFITHDLGVVAQMADRVAVMYAGKFIEEGLTDEIFYEPAHPYTWALLSSMPDLDSKDELYTIPGTPPNMLFPPEGDAFALRSEYALDIDFQQEPPLFEITDTHRAATWLLHPHAPKVEMPKILQKRLGMLKEEAVEKKNKEVSNVSNEKILEVKNLHQYFVNGTGKHKLETRAVDDISFDVYKGECFGIVGESGCGKTTTGRTIIKLHQASKGSVTYQGKVVTLGSTTVQDKISEIKEALKQDNQNEELLRQLKKYKHINKMDPTFLVDTQMIFQDPIESLDPRMTVREIIAEGLEVLGIKNLIQEDGYQYKGLKDQLKEVVLNSKIKMLTLLQKITKKSYEEKISDTKNKVSEINKEGTLTKEAYIDLRVAELLRTVGLLEEHATRYPHEFSGGQRQRIGIARALVMRPKLIIADEPISALDVSIQASVINLLKKLQKDMGITIVFIAHDLSVVKYFSDRIAVMYKGKIVELASSDELFKNPTHPYTKSLLSAIPLPNPTYERARQRFVYQPDFSINPDDLSMIDIGNDHFVYATQRQLDSDFEV